MVVKLLFVKSIRICYNRKVSLLVDDTFMYCQLFSILLCLEIAMTMLFINLKGMCKGLDAELCTSERFQDANLKVDLFYS